MDMADDSADNGEWDIPEAKAAELVRELRLIAQRLDPVPEHLTRAAEASFGWRGIDAELAELSYDSRLDPAGAGLLRGDGDPRLLSFRAETLTIEVEITAARGGYELAGQLIPPGPTTIEVRQPGRSLDLPVDEAGRFGTERLAAGPMSLRCAAAVPVTTQWFPIR